MEPNTLQSTSQPRSHAKDVFLNLGAMVTLYASAAALLNLLFTVINKAYPAVTSSYSYYSASSISFPVATLIIIFPIYILLMWLIEKDATENISVIRKWLSYITLFISGGLIVGDLVAVVYYFLDGQDLTTGFLLKVLSILIVATAVFSYYIADVRNKITARTSKISAICALILVIIAIILGFSVIGSPRTQRMMKQDQMRVSDLQNISNQVREYYRTSAKLPATLNEVASVYSYGLQIEDRNSGAPYEYKVIDVTTFELCATFNMNSDDKREASPVYPYGDPYYNDYGVWSSYKAGESCFRQAVLPENIENMRKPVNF